MSTEKYTDETPMPWGLHKGKKLANVPDHYLLWLYHEKKVIGYLLDYIVDNLESIKANVKNHKQ